MIFLIFVATFVALACVVLPVLTLALFCLTGREDLDVRPATVDEPDDRPAPVAEASPAAPAGARRSSRVSGASPLADTSLPDPSRLVAASRLSGGSRVPDGQTVIT